ncbi:MAG: PQQ-binding-like beta-propeller repeat protein [Bacteroidales bacterium]|nr:PQQ-binding-like beta-propeller repeat protein [Bacteroidales bacterium]
MIRLFKTFILVFLCINVSAQDVAQWRGPNRNGIYNETGLLKKWPDGGPEMLWHFDELGEGYTSAAVTRNGIYTTGLINGNGFIYAFDLKGNLRWKKEYGREWTESHGGVRSTPLVINDKLYFITSFGNLFCMNTSNGQVIWTIDTFKEYGGRNISWGVTETAGFSVLTGKRENKYLH